MLIFSALCNEGVQWYLKFNSSFSNNKIFPVFQAKVMIFHSFLLGSLLCFSAKPFITNRFVWNWFIIVLAVQKASVSLWDKNHGIYIKFWWKYGINVDRLVSNLTDKAKLIAQENSDENVVSMLTWWRCHLYPKIIIASERKCDFTVGMKIMV